jgi:hypothetical protein
MAEEKKSRIELIAEETKSWKKKIAKFNWINLARFDGFCSINIARLYAQLISQGLMGFYFTQYLQLQYYINRCLWQSWVLLDQ